MTDFCGTSIGLEYEFPSLRIVKGGEPKTVLFSSSTASDMRGVKLVLVTVDIATGGDATTELITGPIIANTDNPKWDKLQAYLYDMHQAITDCGTEDKLATTNRVVAKMEGRDDERKEAELDDLGDAVAAVEQRVPSAASTSVATGPCVMPAGGAMAPPPPPPPPAARRQVTTKKKELPEEEQPRFVPADRWFSSTPQVNLGIQIATVGDARFNTFGMLRRNFGGRIADEYPQICSNLDAYCADIVSPAATLRQRLELKGVLTLNLLITVILAAWKLQNLDELDNKKVPYKEGWGVLPKVKPSRLWQAIGGDAVVTPKNFWRAVQRNTVVTASGQGEAERLIDVVLPGLDRRDAALVLLKQLASKNAEGRPWKPAPGAPDPFTVHGCTASLWELRLSATDTRNATICRTDRSTPFGLFEYPEKAHAYFQSCADLAQAQKSDEELLQLGQASPSPSAAAPRVMAPPPPPPPPPPGPGGPPKRPGPEH